MKFLGNDTRTSDHLSLWSGGRQNLIIIQCYFWYLGSKMQKSIEGLLRTISYHILCACPHVVESLLPDRWAHIQECPGSEQPPWSLQELGTVLREAPGAIAKVSTALRSPRCCIFVDGLDEYSGNHSHLVQVLHDLTSTGAMKVCLSSRPWNVFVRAYETSAPHLFLHDLTATDIRLYVESNIRKSLTGPAAYVLDDPSDTRLHTIVSDIVQKAQGVFLWVYLVVQSVVRGFDEGDSIDTLRERVFAFPTDLEEFFDNTLRRVESFYHHHTVQALYLAYLYAEDHHEAASCSSYLDFELLSRNRTGLRDPQYLWDMEPQALSAEDFLSLLKSTRTFLSASCKDLLVINVPRRQKDVRTCAEDPSFVKVQFLHRTVYEFLKTTSHKQWLEQEVPRCFVDRSVFYLLSMAKSKLYWSDRNKQFRPEHYNRQCLFSLGHSWAGLSVAFINQMHACRPFHQDKLSATVGAAYIAFEQLDMFRARYTMAKIRGSEDDEAVVDRELRQMYHNADMPEVNEEDTYLQLFAATLGVAECRGFPYQSVNVNLLKTVMSSSAEIVCKWPSYRQAEAGILLKFLRGSLPSLVEMSTAASEDAVTRKGFNDITLPHMQAIFQLLMYHGLGGMHQIFKSECPVKGNEHYGPLWQHLTSTDPDT